MKSWAWTIAMMLVGCGQTAEPLNEAGFGNEAAAPAPAPDGQDQGTEPSNAGAPAGGDNQSVSACLVQDGERIPENALHAIGTEPFWAADVKGRCVTYSTPENQAGTRVWTQFEGRADNGRWTGALDGQRFVMITRPEPGCSDGMSDNRYPMAVTLVVKGERRTGCAEPR